MDGGCEDPGRFVGDNQRRNHGRIVLETCTGSEVYRPGFIDQIKGREGNVVRVAPQGFGGDNADLFHAADVGGAGSFSQIAQCAQTPLADHLAGVLLNGREDAAYTAGFVADGAVRKGEIAFFRIAVPLQLQQKIVRPRRLAARHDAFHHGTDNVPDLGPDLASRRSQGVWMLVANDGEAGVVIEHDEVIAPPDEDGETRAQAGGNRGLQRLWPLLERSERRFRPVAQTHECSHLAATRKKA